MSKGFNAQYGNTLIIKISSNRGNNKILTAIFTTLVRARTRTVSKKVKRFLLVGRVVMKKLTRAMQHRLETVKESRQRSNFTEPAAITAPLFYLILLAPTGPLIVMMVHYIL